MTYLVYLVRRLTLLRQRVWSALVYYVGLDLQGRLLTFVKKLPATSAGFLLFGYIYGSAGPRYPGTWVAAVAWYRALSWPEKNRPTRWATQRGQLRRWTAQVGRPLQYLNGWLRWAGHPPRWVARPVYLVRGGPARVVPTFRFGRGSRPTELYDAETFSLESVFPFPGEEPFQEVAHEYFDEQQDADYEQDEEPENEMDLLYGTLEGPQTEEDEPGILWRGRHYPRRGREALARKEYYPVEDEVDLFDAEEIPNGSLTRLVGPGDGPNVEDVDDIDVGTSRWDHLADWYHYVTSYTRLTQGKFPRGYYSYLLFEHRGSWTNDPENYPHRWYRKTRGLPTSLLGHRSRGLTVRRRPFLAWWWGHTLWKKKFRPRKYRTPRRILGGRLRRRLRTRRLRRRSRRPDRGVRGWEIQQDLPFGIPTALFQTRFLRWGWRHRRWRVRARAQRLVRRGGLFVRGRRDFPVHRKGPPRWRPLLAGWHAPRYEPLYHHRRGLYTGVSGRSHLGGYPYQEGDLPYSGVGLVAAVVVAAAAAAAAEWVGWSYLAWLSPESGSRGGPRHGFGVSPLPSLAVEAQWAGDLLRKVTPDFHEWWELAREKPPRGERTVTSYQPWRRRVGQNWRHNPGLDLNLFTHRWSENVNAVGHHWWLYNPVANWTEMMTHKAGQDRRGVMTLGKVFQFYYTWQLPSWAHWHGGVSDGWVHRLDLRWLSGELEALTIRREIDLLYNQYAALPPWLAKAYRDGWTGERVNELYGRLWYRSKQENLLYQLVLPQWVPIRGEPAWVVGYLGYWSEVSRWVTWPSETYMDVRAGEWELGLTDQLSPLHGGNLLHSSRWYYHNLPTRWEPYLNGELVRGWSQQVTPTGWATLEERLTRWIPGATPWVVTQLNFLLEWLGPVGRLWWAAAGVTAWVVFRPLWWSTRVVSLTQVAPVTRWTPQWSTAAAITTRVGTLRRGVHRRAHYRRGRRRPLRRVYRTEESHWVSLRRGWSTLDPGRRQPTRVVQVPTRVRSTVTQPERPPTRVNYLAGVAAHLGRHFPARFPTRVGPHRWKPSGVSAPPGWLPRLVTRSGPPGWTTRVDRPVLFRRGWRGYRAVRRVTTLGTRTERHRCRPRRRRGWHRRENPTRAGVVETPGWDQTGPGVAGHLRQRGWHHQRYRATLGGVLPATPGVTPGVIAAAAEFARWSYPGQTGLLEEQTPLVGYDTTWFNEAEFEESIQSGSNGDDEWEDIQEAEIDPDEHVGVRTISLGPDELVGVTLADRVDDSVGRACLVSWRRFRGLPARWYNPNAPADYHGEGPWPATTTVWPTPGVDHPGFRVGELVPYAGGRWGWRSTQVTPQEDQRTRGDPAGVTAAAVSHPGVTARVYTRYAPTGGDLLWPTGVAHLADEFGLTGWAVLETTTPEEDFSWDDSEGVEFGSLSGVGSGYRPAGAAGYLTGTYRAAETTGWGMAPVWSGPHGWNEERYLLGEDLSCPTPPEPEGILLEWLTTSYLDHYDVGYLWWDLYLFVDREGEDLYEGEFFEEENDEIPRTRPRDYPTALLAVAVAGASPGETSPTGLLSRLVDEHGGVGENPEPVLLHRRRVFRRFYRRWRRHRSGQPYPRLGMTLRQRYREWAPGPSWNHADTDGVTTQVAHRLDDHDFTPESLRLWALTEIYLGDVPQGSSVSS